MSPATDGIQQVGYTFDTVQQPNYKAALWSGSASSYVNLNPVGFTESQALGVSNGIQVGFGKQNGVMRGLLWHGSASSFVDISPAATDCIVYGISGGQIVGAVGSGVGFNSNNVFSAGMWTGTTAASFVNLAPAFGNGSGANATNGVQQVGVTTIGPNMVQAATVWTGTAASAQELPPVLGKDQSHALSIDHQGDVVGEAWTNQPNSLVFVEWVPNRLPGDASFDGKVDMSDLMIVARNYGRSGDVGFIDGDFNMDGSVGFDDLVILARNFGAPRPTSNQLAQFDPSFRADVERAFAEVPEPTYVSLLALAAAMMPHRRR